jgi:PBSX family phage terminase large subunit
MKKIIENDDVLIYKCPYCGTGEITIHKQSSHKYGYCDTCDAAYIHYIPLPHQLDVHKDKHKLKLLIGGMGSAKSNCGVMEIINHALTVANGQTLLLAQTLKQLSEAIMPIFDEYLPRKFVKRWINTKQEIKIELNNGHKLIGFASDDEEKFRSMNITAFYIEEASGVRPKIFQECVRRLRNVHGIIKGKAHYVGIICSNPAQGFIRDLLFTASQIKGSNSIKNTVEMYEKRVKNKNDDLAAFLSSSRDNPYLPPGFITSVINSLTPAQVRLYVDCIIEYAEGAVYPTILSMTEEPFEIPRHWIRYMAHDPGIHDPSAILLGAIDPETGIIHFYREYYKKDQVLAQVARAWKEMTADIPQGCLRTPLIDPSANKRSKTTGRTYKQQLQIEHNIVTKNANNNIEDGIQRTKNLMYYGKVRFFNTLTNTLYEGCEYRYPTQEERNKNKNLGDTPLDKDNHLMDCLRYICQDIPYDYVNMNRISYNNYLKFFDNLTNEKEVKKDNLSFNQLIDIIKAEYDEEASLSESEEFFGGYKL